MSNFDKINGGLEILSRYDGADVDSIYGSPGIFVTNGRVEGATIPLEVSHTDSIKLQSLNWHSDGVAWCYYY